MHLPRSVQLPLQDSHELASVVHDLAISERTGTAPIRSPFERVVTGDRDFLGIQGVFNRLERLRQLHALLRCHGVRRPSSCYRSRGVSLGSCLHSVEAAFVAFIAKDYGQVSDIGRPRIDVLARGLRRFRDPLRFVPLSRSCHIHAPRSPAS